MPDAKIDRELMIPDGGFWPAPEVPQPNIYLMEWRRDRSSPRSTRSPSYGLEPADLLCKLRAEDFTPSSGWGIMYWFPCWPTSMLPVRRVRQSDDQGLRAARGRSCPQGFSRSQGTMNHECCQRAIAALWPGPAELAPFDRLERAAHNNIGWLFHTTAAGTERLHQKPSAGTLCQPCFTSFMMGEMASTLFRGMASGTRHGVRRDVPADRG
jgi:hypothetical protein